MYKNDITSKTLKEKIKFYRNMSNSVCRDFGNTL